MAYQTAWRIADKSLHGISEDDAQPIGGYLEAGEGFIVDLGVGEHDGGVRSEGGQGLGGLAVMDMVETVAQDLAVERDGRPLAGCRVLQQPFGVAPQNLFESGGIERLQNVTQRVQGWRPLQIDAEIPVEMVSPLIEKGDDPAIGTAAAQQRKNREHQQTRQRVTLALRPARIGNIGQRRQKTRKRNHRNSSPPELLTDYSHKLLDLQTLSARKGCDVDSLQAKPSGAIIELNSPAWRP